jgi:hypothetical protein
MILVLVVWFVLSLPLGILAGRAMRDPVCPCPLCDCFDAVVDGDGVALCLGCRCSFEVVR